MTGLGIAAAGEVAGAEPAAAGVRSAGSPRRVGQRLPTLHRSDAISAGPAALASDGSGLSTTPVLPFRCPLNGQGRAAGEGGGGLCAAVGANAARLCTDARYSNQGRPIPSSVVTGPLTSSVDQSGAAPRSSGFQRNVARSPAGARSTCSNGNEVVAETVCTTVSAADRDQRGRGSVTARHTIGAVGRIRPRRRVAVDRGGRAPDRRTPLRSSPVGSGGARPTMVAMRSARVAPVR